MEIKRREYEEEYNKLSNRLGKVFSNELGFQNMQKYLRGLLGSAERKNGWQQAAHLGESTPYTLQQFICRGHYSADNLREELRGYVSENLGETDGILVVDEKHWK